MNHDIKLASPSSSLKPQLSRLSTAWHALRYFGPRWVASRSLYALARRTGWWERRLPARSWEAFDLADLLAQPRLADPALMLAARRVSSLRFFFAPTDRAAFQSGLARFDAASPPDCVNESQVLAEGRVRFFGGDYVDVGSPPAWHRHPETGRDVPRDAHWSRLDDFTYGDIKLLWEPARFSFAFALVRANWRTGDERHAERFWQAFESFYEQNPPQLGAHWKCGQEISLRLFALSFALYGFLDAAATTPKRVAKLVRFVAVSAGRVEANLAYALSQANNHGISEAAGLFTVGTLFPELRDASRWRTIGRRALHEEARRLIYDDGAFSQHSINYHRVVLHDYVWSLRLADLAGEPLDADVRRRVLAAADFLATLVNERTGHAPNYGHNDGALILPLSNCPFADFRSVVQSARLLAGGTRTYDAGPWDEESLWLLGTNYERPVRQPAVTNDLSATTSGHYTLHSTTSQLLTRAAAFKHRPSQADLLHVDLSWRDVPIAIDPGTYRYNAPDPWNNALGDTAFHNTVTVDEQNQMLRAGRFLWMPWATGRVAANVASPAGSLRYWEGLHDGYQRSPIAATHRRAIWRIGDEAFLVYDRLTSDRPHDYRLHWLFADYPHVFDPVAGQLMLTTPKGEFWITVGGLNNASASVIRADPASPRGWYSPTYNSKLPAISLDLRTQAASASFWTLLAPPDFRIDVNEADIAITSPTWTANLTLNHNLDSARTIFAQGKTTAAPNDELQLS